MIRTFIDTGVLITAARGNEADAQIALQILQDPNREFASSPFLKLEVLPKALFNQKSIEAEFYEAYFEAISHWAMDLEKVLQAGYQQAATHGLGAMDALHIAAALATDCQEFITSEKPNKSIHRTPSIPVISIFA